MVRAAGLTAPQIREAGTAVGWTLLNSVFDETLTLYSGAFSYICLAVLAWHISGRSTTLWISLATLLFGCRLMLARAFRADRQRFERTTWIGLCAIGGGAMALLWGLASLSAYSFDARIIAVAVAGIQTAFIYGSASRNAASPTVAISQVLICSTAVCAIDLSRHDAYAKIFACFVAFNIAPSLLIVRIMHARLLQSACADEKVAQLLAAVTRTKGELQTANAQLIALASTDDLTGIANRRRLDHVLATEWARAQHDNTAISLYIADVDWFKLYNDALGHPAGDACLRDVARVLARSLHRPGDVLGRYGGEEFVAILPRTDACGASEIAERARAAVEELAVLHPASVFGRITLSIGVVTLVATPGVRCTEMVRLADVALYRAKGLGRNRVCVAPAGSGDETAGVH
jgi:diguanylate cyclase (GGDEF)-like protein